MTDVISFRTDKIEQLKLLAQNKGITISNLSSKIIEDYVNYFDAVKTRKFICMPREMVSLLYDSVDPSKLDEIIALTTKWAITDLKITYKHITYQKLFEYIQMWFDYNGFILKQFEGEDFIKYACKHDMSKNWGTISANILLGIYEAFGFDGMIEEITDDYFSFKIKAN